MRWISVTSGMSRTARTNFANQASLWLAVFSVTNTVVPTLSACASRSVTVRRMTPSCCSFWMRRQHGTLERPTRSAISAAVSSPLVCSRSRILASSLSIETSVRPTPSARNIVAQAVRTRHCFAIASPAPAASIVCHEPPPGLYRASRLRRRELHRAHGTGHVLWSEDDRSRTRLPGARAAAVPVRAHRQCSDRRAQRPHGRQSARRAAVAAARQHSPTAVLTVLGLLRALIPPWPSLRQAAPGIAVAVALALLARAIADALAHGAAGLPRLPLSPVMCAVVLGMLWRNTLGVPGWATGGLRWAMHQLLRTGIALVGLRLTLAGASSIALTALPVALTCLSVALLAGLGLARLFGVGPRLGALLAIGTAVCGCTAVVAMSPVIRARHAETAFAITCVVLFGCLAMLIYPWVAGHFFAASPVRAGVFLGTAIHDTSQVMGAALIYSQQSGAPAALAAASVAKLLRNLSIAVLVPLAAWRARRHGAGDGDEHLAEPRHAGLAPHARLVPMFVLAFLGFIA